MLLIVNALTSSPASIDQFRSSTPLLLIVKVWVEDSPASSSSFRSSGDTEMSGSNWFTVKKAETTTSGSSGSLLVIIISALNSIKSIVGDHVGYGLHAPDPETIYFAIAYSASFVFFYVIENDDEYYPDYEHSLRTDKLGDWLIKWRESQKWIGSGKKNKQNLPEWIFE